jgi:putative NADPH-quinone reductase
MKRVLIIQGHPDATAKHLAHALSDAYEEGAKSVGHEIRRVDIGAIEFPFLRSQVDWEHGSVPASLEQAQADMAWASHQST